jgi:hypothetical protein
MAIVVSEETGSISICENGKLERNLSEKQFRERLSAIFFSGPNTHPHEIETFEKLDRQDPLSTSSNRDLVSD